jgi:SAM-dependent methyltransferase
MFARPRHEEIYAQARYVDVGFDVRDLSAECGFLEHLSRHVGRGALNSYLEVCCGPGYHLHHFAGRGTRAYGAEYARTMVAYAREKARRLAEAAGFAAAPSSGDLGENLLAAPPLGQVIETDPRELSLPEAVDLAFMPWPKFGYLIKDDEVIEHLVTVAKNIGRGGIYVLELDHPATIFGYPERAPRRWRHQRGETQVTVQWGSEEELVDPITHVTDVEVTLEASTAEGTESFRDTAPMRRFTHRELRALVRLSGAFDWTATFGDLSVTQPFDLSEGARRMVPVLRCSV